MQMRYLISIFGNQTESDQELSNPNPCTNFGHHASYELKLKKMRKNTKMAKKWVWPYAKNGRGHQN